MRKGKVLLLASLLVLWALPAMAAVTKAQVEAFVKEAVAYAKAEGKDKALVEFMNPGGKFIREGGELYIYAYDYSGTVLSHGAKPKLVGKNLMMMTDPKGLKVIEELVKHAKKGQGWQKFMWENPETKKVESKLGFVMKVDDSWWLGSGMYGE